MEMCAVLDGSRTPTGRSVVRGTKLLSGEYHLVVHVWIRNETGEYLVQQRASYLASNPDIWATTVGFVQIDEDSRDAAIRETREELGVDLSSSPLRLFDRLKTGDRIEDLWLADVLRHTLGAPTLGSEVSDWKWVTKPELRQLISRGDFFGYSYFDQLPE